MTDLALPREGPLSRGSNYIMDYKSLIKCQSSVRPAGLQAHNVATNPILYTYIRKKKKEKHGSRGLRGHMWGLRCGGPLAPKRTLATHTVSTASRPAGDCCIGVKEATVLPGRRGSRGVLLSLEHPGQPTPSRQRHDPKATAALVSRMPGA